MGLKYYGTPIHATRHSDFTGQVTHERALTSQAALPA
jgi:hypothetical protein